MDKDAVIRDVEDTLTEFNGWKDGYTQGAKLGEEPYIVVRAAVLIGDYLSLLNQQKQKEPTT